ncbi:MAG: serine/threonine protein kinase [Actinobacteria bacterium]|nr:serine/threonine protein kinase [Actinomycetota bacterium]
MSDDDRGAPPTRIEGRAAGAPPTRIEQQAGVAPPTRIEPPRAAGAPPTRHEEPVPPPVGGRGRGRTQRLPEELEERFDYQHDIGYGAQAAVLLCRQRDDGRLVALKLYHPTPGSVGASAAQSLAGTSEDHVTPILDHGLAGKRLWEVQEYFPLGSIRDLAEEEGLPLPAEDVLEFVRDLAAALTHIHDLGIVHRDLKPENILVRTRRPLDCVIGDFGLARELVVSRHVGSVAGTFPYSSREATYGSYSRASDWWSLGVIAHELLTGRHMFTDSDGTFLPEPEIRVALNERTWAVTGVADPRFQRLFAGLICDDAEQRWGAEQVVQWLDGGDPPLPRVSKVEAPGSGRRAVARMFFEGEQHATPAELATGFREHFDAACDVLVGVRLSDLRDWLHQTEIGTDADELLAETRSGNIPPQRAMVELLNILDPESPPVFQGAELSPAGLADLCRRATAAQDGAVSTVVDLRQQHILSAAAKRAPDAEDLARADARLTALWKAADTFLQAAAGDTGLRPWVGDARRALEAVLLYAALVGKESPLVEGAIDLATEGAAESPAVLRSWSNALRPGDASAQMVARAAVVMVFTPLVTAAARAREAEERAAAAKREEAQRAAAQAEQERQRELARQERVQARSRARQDAVRRLRNRAIAATVVVGGMTFYLYGAGFAVPQTLVTLGIPALMGVLLSVLVDLVLPSRAGSGLSWMTGLTLGALTVIEIIASEDFRYGLSALASTVENSPRVPLVMALGYAAGSVVGALLGAAGRPAGQRGPEISGWARTVPFLGFVAGMAQLGLNAAGMRLSTPLPDFAPEFVGVVNQIPVISSLEGTHGAGLAVVGVTTAVTGLVLFAGDAVRALPRWFRVLVLLVANALGAVTLVFTTLAG